MTTIIGMDKPSLEEALEHHGVKGMKWGVRRENRLQLNKRVAEGTGSKTDKVRVALTQVSKHSVKKNKGFQNAAGAKTRELEQRKARIQKGEATVGDFLALHGGDRIRDVSGSKKYRAPVKLTANASDHPITKKVKSDHNKLSDKEFANKYAVTKSVYAKRVAKYGDPYVNSPAAKLGKRLGASKAGQANAANVKRHDAKKVAKA